MKCTFFMKIYDFVGIVGKFYYLKIVYKLVIIKFLMQFIGNVSNRIFAFYF